MAEHGGFSRRDFLALGLGSAAALLARSPVAKAAAPESPESDEAFVGTHAKRAPVVEERHKDVVVGAGVGGSTLVYGGIMAKPSRELFDRVMPSGLDYDSLERVYYPRVQSVMGFQPIPDDILAHPRYRATQVFMRDCEKADLP